MRGVNFVSLEEKILQAKNNTKQMNDLLSEYKPFIQKAVYDTCHRYIEWGRDEELSIGLLAFEETIKRYKPGKGSFLSLARQVIKSRVIDYLRKENKHRHLVIEQVQDDIIDSSPINFLTEEIKELQTHLAKFDIAFHQLPNISPVKKQLREELKYAAKVFVKETELMNQLLERKQIPVRTLANQANISYKKIERNRLYVITMAFIWYLDLPLLQDYIK